MAAPAAIGRETWRTPPKPLLDSYLYPCQRAVGATKRACTLPASFINDKSRQYAASYAIHGFGGDHHAAWNQGDSLVEKMESGKRMEMVHVYLDANFSTGHHVFADSINNGPWGKALTEEFIPYLERTYRLIPQSRARFVTGHSSGGWSSLWLQVNYPDFFGGTWSTAPDPVDFRSFTFACSTSESV